MLAWTMPHCWAGLSACARPLGPIPWACWGYFWDWAGALGWFQMFQCEQEKMGTDGWRVPISGSCWEHVIFRAFLTLLGLWSHFEKDIPL